LLFYYPVKCITFIANTHTLNSFLPTSLRIDETLTMFNADNNILQEIMHVSTNTAVISVYYLRPVTRVHVLMEKPLIKMDIRALVGMTLIIVSSIAALFMF